MPKSDTSANTPRLPALTRRSFLTGAAAASLAPRAAATQLDAELTALEGAFEQALAVFEAAQRHFNACEERYFDLLPPRPAALTSAGPLGHLLLRDWCYWSADELRWLLADPDRRDTWEHARAMLPFARAYEARLRRLSRVVGLKRAEADCRVASDALCDIGMRAVDEPARSLAGLAIKARVVKLSAAPEWWEEKHGIAERIAAQVLDAVIAVAEQGHDRTRSHGISCPLPLWERASPKCQQTRR